MKRRGGLIIVLPLVLSVISCYVIGMCLLITVSSAHFLREAGQKSWDRGVWWLLGKSYGETSANYSLSPEELAKAKELGIDPDLLVRASAVEAWADSLWGRGAGDRAIYMALTSGESANCTNCGNSDACNEYYAHPSLNGPAQCAALDDLLIIWKAHDIRSSNPTAAKYIYSDYSGALGSSGGGALGCSQFLAGTAIPHLNAVGEPFDLWDPLTAMKVMAAEVHRLGYRKDMNSTQKINVLLGWNQHRGWISGIVATARQYASYLGTRSGLSEVIEGYEGYEQEWWQKVLEAVLWVLGLLPEEPPQAWAGDIMEDDAIVLDGDWQFPVHGPTILTSDAQDHLNRGSVPAWDFYGDPGTLVYPAQAGVVTIASYGNEGGYGHWVEIKHANGYRTRYCHLGTLQVKVGERVDISSPLGEIARTGLTSWPHTHFEVLDTEHGRRQVDPALVFGRPEEIGLTYIFWTNLPPDMRW